MKFSQILALAGVSLAFSATASAQFSVTGPGAAIPAVGSGGGGGFPGFLPPNPGVSTVDVPTDVGTIDSLVIGGLTHTWIGDTQATLTDPNGVAHLIFVRPGTSATGTPGNSGNFTGGDYTFFESGFAPLPSAGNAAAGSYNQSFDSGGGFTWTSGDAGVLNTPLSGISGPAGTWTLSIYDWAAGDTGSFTSWTLNGSAAGGGNDNSGAGFCFGDGSGATCPCSAFGGTGEGCMNSSGSGASLTGSGNASLASDSFVLDVAGVAGARPGLLLRADNEVALPVGNGLLCISGGSQRSDVHFTDAAGATTFTEFRATNSFASVANAAGIPTLFQYWYRDDSAGQCTTNGFNFTNAWSVTYLP